MGEQEEIGLTTCIVLPLRQVGVNKVFGVSRGTPTPIRALQPLTPHLHRARSLLSKTTAGVRAPLFYQDFDEPALPRPWFSNEALSMDSTPNAP